jgi:glycosyltransferase involved in cell wall biosynthesis
MEGMPLIILEAMSLGVPIISTPVGGIPSLVQEGINGALSESTQLEAIYDAVCRFHSYSAEQKEHIAKNNVTKFNEKFHMRICAHNYLQLYNL